MSVAARLAKLKARRSPPAPTLLPSTDAAELVASYRPVEPDWRSRPLRGHPVAVIDTETTGIDPTTARIVEVAVVVIDRLGETEPRVALSTRVDPGEPIPEAATAVHGIGDADVAGCPSWADLWPDFRRAVDGHLLSAYNAPYDYQVLGAEYRRTGLTVGPRRSGAPRYLDPLVLAKLCDKFEKGKRLADVAARRGIEVDAHGAAGDAMTTAMLLPILLGEAARLERRGRVVPERPTARDLETVGGYLDWQLRTALAHEVDFVAFRGAPAECPWHELAGRPAPTPPRREVATSKCKGCGAGIVWAVTSAGARIPLDPTEIRASEAGPGRAVSLVVEGGTVRQLREDPDGDVVGRESHFATCPSAAEHRKPRPAEPTTSTVTPEATEPAGAVISLALGSGRTWVLTEDLVLHVGRRVPDGTPSTPTDVVVRGRCVSVTYETAAGRPVYDAAGRTLPQPSPGGGITWHRIDEDGDDRRIVRLAVPPPLRRST